MLPQKIKDIYFNLFAFPLSKIRLPLSKLILRNRVDIKVNLGSGKTYIAGFINIDGNIKAKKDLFLDLRAGLPFRDNSVSCMYSSHVFEHFYTGELLSILREAYRVLLPAGVLRIVVPDMELGINKYITKDRSFFSDFPLSFSSMGGRLVNFLFCDGQHKAAFDFLFLKELLFKSGFLEENIKKASCLETNFLDQGTLNKLHIAEEAYAQNSLFIEAIK